MLYGEHWTTSRNRNQYLCINCQRTNGEFRRLAGSHYRYELPRPTNTMSESFADLFEESLNTIEMAPGSIVTGTVVDIDDDWVVVHAGLKSEGVIPKKNQFLNEEGRLHAERG